MHTPEIPTAIDLAEKLKLSPQKMIIAGLR